MLPAFTRPKIASTSRITDGSCVRWSATEARWPGSTSSSRTACSRTASDGAPSLAGGFEPQILVRPRIREALDPVDARLLDARPHAPEERELVDGHVHHAVVHDRLDLVQHGLALLAVQLARLTLEEILDLRDHARRVDAVLGDVGRD